MCGLEGTGTYTSLSIVPTKGRSMRDSCVESTTNVFSLSWMQADIHVIINKTLSWVLLYPGLFIQLRYRNMTNTNDLSICSF